MTDQPAGCPTSDQLKALIDGDLPEHEQSTIQKHVDGCDACQKSLEALVAGSQSWDAAMNRLRGEPSPAGETVLADAMRRMKADEYGHAVASKSIAFNPADYLDPSDHPGSVGKLGPYEITEVIGQGGMGVVLKAFDSSLHRVVAVKVLAPYLAHNPQARKRFVREAKAIAAVSHDHVITIHGIDESTDQPKIVMQFVAGKSLQQKIDADGSLDLKEILRIGMQTASGLAAAHAQGLVHRDVKPSNILLENGVQRVKLTDFGLARAVDDASLTQSGVIAGTPQYMAPEQANGDAVDFRADLFSLGSVMYAMCVGHSPFRASTTMGVLKRVCHDPPRPIQELNPDIPDWLCVIIMKLLQKKPEDRFSTAKEVAELLEKWLAHVQQPMATPKPAQLDQASTFRARNPQSDRPTFSERSESQEPQYARQAIDRRTIFFQSISWRWFAFFMLVGMAVSVAVSAHEARNQRPVSVVEVVLVGALMGLVISFWGFLLLGLGRFVWANIYGKPPGFLDDHNGDGRRKTLAPESIAVLAAIVVLCFGGPILLAAVIAIIVWRIAKGRENAIGASPKSRSTAEPVAGVVRNENAQYTIPLWIYDFDAWVFNVFRSLIRSARQRLSASSPERDRLLITIGWCIAGGVDLVIASNDSSESGLTIATFLFSMLSFATAINVYWRQNPRFVRMASFIALVPVAPGLLVRIPLGIVTLLWQNRASTKDSFEPTPWRETHLGRWIYGPLRLIVTFGWITAWSVGCLVFLAAVTVLYIIPSGPSIYHVRDEARVTLKGHPNAEFRLAAFGTGESAGLRPPARDYRRQEVLVQAAKMGSNYDLRLRLGDVVKNELTHHVLTEPDIQRFFTSVYGADYPEHAANLYDAIQHLNSTGGFSADVPADHQRGPTSLFESVSRTRETLEQIDAGNNSPPPGFIELRSMLDPRLFLVDHGTYPSTFESSLQTPSVELGLIFGIIVWLMGIAVISKRRHFRKAKAKPLVNAVAS